MRAKRLLVGVVVAAVLFVVAGFIVRLPSVRVRLLAYTIRGGSCVIRIDSAAVIDNRYEYIKFYSTGSGGVQNNMAACADSDGVYLYDGGTEPVCSTSHGTSGCKKHPPELEALFGQIHPDMPNLGLNSSHTVKMYTF